MTEHPLVLRLVLQFTNYNYDKQELTKILHLIAIPSKYKWIIQQYVKDIFYTLVLKLMHEGRSMIIGNY